MKKILIIVKWISFFALVISFYFEIKYADNVTYEVARFFDRYSSFDCNDLAELRQFQVNSKNFPAYLNGRVQIIKSIVYLQAFLLVILVVNVIIERRRTS